jgi:3-dehydroquinate synthase
MSAAVLITHRLGMVDAVLVDRHRSLLERFGLPTTADGISPDAVLEATRADKKSRGGAIQWVLLEGPGRAVIRGDVPEEIVRRSVADVLGQGRAPAKGAS